MSAEWPLNLEGTPEDSMHLCVRIGGGTEHHTLTVIIGKEVLASFAEHGAADDFLGPLLLDAMNELLES